jgi:hypothetical protein
MSLLQNLEKQRKKNIRTIKSIRFMRRGTISEPYLKVPQKVKEPLLRGPYYVLSWNEDGKTRGIRLKPNELEQTKKDIKAYKNFQILAKEFVKIAEAMTKKSRSQAKALKKLLFYDEYNSEIERFCNVVRQNLDTGQKITMEDLEEGMREAALRDGAIALSKVLALIPDIPDNGMKVLCPLCKRPLQREGLRSKKLTGLLGEGVVSRCYYSCITPGCNGHRFPKDGCLDISNTSFSLGVRRLMARFGNHDSFEIGRQNLKIYKGKQEDGTAKTR